jgi:hypothetical protein
MIRFTVEACAAGPIRAAMVVLCDRMPGITVLAFKAGDCRKPGLGGFRSCGGQAAGRQKTRRSNWLGGIGPTL